MAGPSLPLNVSGVIKNSNGVVLDGALVTFTTSVGVVLGTSNTSGQYVVDLVSLGYTSGQTITWECVDSNNNQFTSGSFVATGDTIDLDITLVERTNEQMINSKGNTNPQIHNIGGKGVSKDNPFPVILDTDFQIGAVEIKDGNSDNRATVNSTGQLHTVMRGTEDSGNSTITPLLANASFTGTAIDTLDYCAVSIVLHTDKASATDGLSVQYSADGTDWHGGEVYTIVAGATKFFTPTLQARYMRVIYTNGGDDQTDFHLHTTLRKNPIKWSSHNIDDPIKDEDDATLTKSVITGKKADGTYDNVNLTNGANMKVSLEELESGISSNSNSQLNVTQFDESGGAIDGKDFYLRVAQGLVTGYSIMSKFGQHDGLTGTYEDIWDGGGTYPYPANATAPITHLYSTDNNDVQDIEVQGLNVDGTLTIQTITLTGTTVVALDTDLWRIFRLKNVGTANNLGIIHASVSDKATSYAQIGIGNNQTLMALYTIPLGYTGYMLKGTNNLIGTNRAYSIAGKMMMRPYGLVFQLKKTFGLQADGSSFLEMTFPLPAKIPARTDIRVSALSSATGGINTTFEVLLVQDGY